MKQLLASAAGTCVRYLHAVLERRAVLISVLDLEVFVLAGFISSYLNDEGFLVCYLTRSHS